MTVYRTTASVLRLRAAPGTDHAITGRLPQGTMLDLVQGPVRGWARVRADLHDGMMTGWVSADHIDVLVTAPPLVEPVWLTIARAELGVREIGSTSDDPRISEYHRATGLTASLDQVTWCGSFVNWCMLQAGIPGTNNASARSWAHWGQPLDEPCLGCVAVFSDATHGNATIGHVAFFLERAGDEVHVLGGEYGTGVRISSRAANDLIGYRWNG